MSIGVPVLLILVSWAVGLYRKPIDLSVLFDLNYINRASYSSNPSIIVSTNSRLDDADGKQYVSGYSFWQFSPYTDAPRMFLGAHLESNIHVIASVANPTGMFLKARRTGPSELCSVCPPQSRSSPVNESNFRPTRLSSTGQKHSIGNKSITALSNLPAPRNVHHAHRPPMVHNALLPRQRDIVKIRRRIKLSLYRVNGIQGDFSVAPTLNNIVRKLFLVRSASESDEYKLIAECRNFAIQVVWRSGIVVYRSAISGHDEFIFREVEHNNRPRVDLGECSIRHYGDSSYIEKFSHVDISSGEASLLGFSGDSNVATCSGCTLLVSRNKRNWYEIVAVQ